MDVSFSRESDFTCLFSYGICDFVVFYTYAYMDVNMLWRMC